MSGSIFAASLRSIPLALTIFRICSAPVLVVLAAMGRERYFLGLAVAALLSDVLDGAIARRLGAASETGRLLDSWADLLIALVAFVGATLLWPDTMRQEALYFALVLAALVAPNAYALVRFRRLLGYHTVSAKSSGVLLSVGAVLMFMGITPMLFRVAAIVEVLVAAEYVAISCLIPGWTGEVKSIVHAMQLRRAATAG
ncbi:MAG TPA: CDP-alcohol phosphatidyltransferase family protein [Gemmatimonadaceae bacterium]|nr:CDP-alcohol phosphatidyltransferase family protein [Gemmatimonadaceae bacterium]